jgi:hypothetical protein
MEYTGGMGLAVALPRQQGLPLTQGDAMPDNINLNPGNEASPDGENLCPASSSSGKKGSQKHEVCNGAGKVIEGIGGA